jgi:hypothetical protein
VIQCSGRQIKIVRFSDPLQPITTASSRTRAAGLREDHGVGHRRGRRHVAVIVDDRAAAVRIAAPVGLFAVVASFAMTVRSGAADATASKGSSQRCQDRPASEPEHGSGDHAAINPNKRLASCSNRELV